MEMAIGRVRESEGQRRRGEDCMFIAEKDEEEECRVWHTIPEEDKEHFELFSMSPYFL